MASRIHQNGPDVVLQAAVFEIVTEGVGEVPVPDWVFQEFGEASEARKFDYAKMLFPDKRFVDHWRRGSSVPDICQMETKMWFFFLAASYMNAGIEAIHFGQLDLMGRNDPEYRNWADLLQHVRHYAANRARRHYVICDAHVPKAGPVVDGKLLLDFHSFPLRPKEVADSPQKAVLEVPLRRPLRKEQRGHRTERLEMRTPAVPCGVRQFWRHADAGPGFAGERHFDFHVGL